MTPRYTHPDHDLLLAKAGTLIEALPWIGQFAGETVVIKYGGNAMIDDDNEEIGRASCRERV